MKMIICLKGGSQIEIDLSKSIVHFGRDKLVVDETDDIKLDYCSQVICLPLDIVEAFKL